mmetsp:Transcript_23912/g.75182  ORF Transcript_23912/g.75182 Transcript_23912/m.75182 type:complete len:90 (+) Transcript_23912:166-435(+)
MPRSPWCMQWCWLTSSPAFSQELFQLSRWQLQGQLEQPLRRQLEQLLRGPLLEQPSAGLLLSQDLLELERRPEQPALAGPGQPSQRLPA